MAPETSFGHSSEPLSGPGYARCGSHDLRHSCNSLLGAQGVSARVRMEILGHSDIRLTENVYTHVVPASIREALEGMGRVLALAT